MATAAERLRQLQQHSQSLDPANAGPFIPGGPGIGQEDPSAVVLPDQPEAPKRLLTPADVASDREALNREASTRRSAELARRGGEAVAAKTKKDTAQGAFWDANVSDPDFVQSGILPGEEQVTSHDTFRTLDQEQQRALRGKYDTSGHGGTMSFEDWLSENYAELPPEERAAQMRSQGAATPRIQAGRDPRLEPGKNSAVAQSRQAAGKPLPEGREASQYTPEQRRTMQRNVHSPEVPMQRFGGTFAHNVDGSLSSRAPNPDALKAAAAIAADPTQGVGSPSHIMALANAYGIDAMQYGDDMDMLRADVMREKERHDRLAQKYDVVSNNMGGFRYTPNSATNEMVERRKDYIRANDIGRRFAGMLSKQQEAELDAAAGDNLNQRLQLQLNRGIAQTARNNISNRNMTIAANNPRVAQGLYMRSLQEAAQSGDPFQVAAVHSAFGNDRAARDYMGLAGVQQEAAAGVAAAEADARSKNPSTDPTEADRFAREMDSALRNPDAAVRRMAVIGVLRMARVPEEQLEKRADEILASSNGGALNPTQTRSFWQRLIEGGGQAAARTPEEERAIRNRATVAPQPQVPMFDVPNAPPVSQYPPAPKPRTPEEERAYRNRATSGR